MKEVFVHQKRRLPVEVLSNEQASQIEEARKQGSRYPDTDHLDHLARRYQENPCLEIVEMVLADRHIRSILRGRARLYFAAGLPGVELSDFEQEAQLAVFQAMIDFDPNDGTPFIVFCSIVVNRALNNARKKALRKKHSPLNDSDRAEWYTWDDNGEPLDYWSSMPDGDKTPEELVLESAISGLIDEVVALCQLSDHEEYVVRKKAADYTQAEISILWHKIKPKDKRLKSASSVENTSSFTRTQVERRIVTGNSDGEAITVLREEWLKQALRSEGSIPRKPRLTVLPPALTRPRPYKQRLPELAPDIVRWLDPEELPPIQRCLYEGFCNGLNLGEIKQHYNMTPASVAGANRELSEKCRAAMFLAKYLNKKERTEEGVT
jgi:hypothetical protein